MKRKKSLILAAAVLMLLSGCTKQTAQQGQLPERDVRIEESLESIPSPAPPQGSGSVLTEPDSEF